jgi:hypothetical protein
MKIKNSISAFLIAVCLLFSNESICAQHDIIFCGEKIPVENSFVADKLMNVIRQQIPNVNLAELRRRVKLYFPTVEYYLHETGLPDDFKYLAIVESGFQNQLMSSAGAGGFWQLMEPTARELGLTVNALIDERKDIHKSTHAACKVLAAYYLDIKKRYGISSWVLTAAAYNFGIGNMGKAISRQGKNYFQMDLNDETAKYVYKIIAVKELFEYPELYIKNFGYNVFNSKNPASQMSAGSASDQQVFSQMKISVNEADGKHPDKLKVAEVVKNGQTIQQVKTESADAVTGKINYVSAEVKGKYKNFKDGDVISFELDDHLQVNNRFTGKGNIVQGRGWIIDDRIMVDLGYGRNVLLYDMSDSRGLAFSSLKNKTSVILKVFNKAD